MEPFYIAVFGVIAALSAALELTKSKSTSTENSSRDFSRFRSNYVLVYSLMMGALSVRYFANVSAKASRSAHLVFSCIEDSILFRFMPGCQHIVL